MENINTNAFQVSPNLQLPPVEEDTVARQDNLNDAYYAAFLSESEDPLNVYTTIVDDLETLGTSEVIKTLRNHYRASEDQQRAMFIEDLVANNELSLPNKRKILEQQLRYNDPEQAELRSAYLDTVANMELADMPEFSDAQAEAVNLKIQNIKTKEDFNKMMVKLNGYLTGNEALPILDESQLAKLSEDEVEGFFEEAKDVIVREPAVLFESFILALVPYISEIVGTGVIYTQDALMGLDTNVTKARSKARNIINRTGAQWLYDTYHDFLGFFGVEKEELEEAFVTKGFQNLDEGLTWAANKISPNDPDLAKIPLEILAGIGIGYGIKKGPSFAKERAMQIKDPDGYKLYKAFQEQDIKGYFDQTKKAETYDVVDAREVGIVTPKDSVFDQTIETNKNMGNVLAEAVMTDQGSTAIKAIKYDYDGWITRFVLPKMLGFDPTATGFGATYLQTEMLLGQKQIVHNLYVENPFFKNNQVYKSWTEDNVSVVNESLLDANLDLNIAQSEYIPLDFGVKMELAFNKKGYNYENFNEANQAALVLRSKVEKLSDDPGQVAIQVMDLDGNAYPFYIEAKPGMTPQQVLASQGLDSNNVSYQVKWIREGEFFDEIRQVSDGFGHTPYRDTISIYGHEFKGLTNLREKVFDSDIWNWIAAFGRSKVSLERDWAISHMASEQIAATQLRTLAKGLDLYDGEYRTHLAKLLKESRNVSDTFNIQEIYQILGKNIDIKKAQQLQDTLKLFRQMDRFNYRLLNTYQINRALANGFKDYVDIVKGDGSRSRHMAAQIFEFDISNPPRQIFDMQTKTPVDFILTDAHKLAGQDKVPQFLSQNGTKGRQIVQLEQPLKIDGQKFDYVLVDNSYILKGAPDWIVPTKTGHISRISLGNFFVKIFPERTMRNGYESIVKAGEKASDVHKADGISLAMFTTEQEALAWLNENKTKVPELRQKGYQAEVVKAQELSFDDLNLLADESIETNRIRQTIARPARASNENMYKTIYEDPLTSFVMTSQRLGTDVMMQPILAQMRAQWVNAHNGKNVTIRNIDKNNPYPKQESDIRPIPGKEKEFKRAMNEWRQMDIINAGHHGNKLGQALAMGADIIGNATDSPMFEFLRKKSKGLINVPGAARNVQRNPNIILDYPRRVVSTFKITFAALWRNLSLQPIGIFGPLIVGPNTTRALLDSAATAHLRVMRNKTFAKYKDLNAEVFKYAYEQNRISKSLEIGKDKLSQNDHLLILKHFDESGYGIISDHVLAKGLFNSSPMSLKNGGFLGKDTTFGRRAVDGLNLYGKVGFEFGEFLNRTGMWHASRQLWMQNNPGKNWRTRKALDEITYDAHRLAGSMTKQNTYAFQRHPLTTYIGQFQAFGMKASESIWNKGASPYNGSQRAWLAAYNFGVFGIRGGVIYGIGDLIVDYFKATGQDDIVEKLDDLTLTKLVINNLADVIMPTYDKEGNLINSEANVAAVYSPFGTQFGGVYMDFWKTAARIFGYDDPQYQFGPATQTALEAIDTYQLIKAMYGDPTTSFDDKMIHSIKELAKLTSGGKSLFNTFMYNANNEKINKHGQTSGVPESKFDQLARAFSVPSYKEQAKFEAWSGLTDKEEQMKQLADSFWRAQLSIKGYDATFAQITEAYHAINFLSEFSDSERQIFWDHLIVLDNRKSGNTIMDSFHNKVLEKHRANKKPKYSTEEISAMKEYTRQTENTPEYKNTRELIINQLEQMKED